jgi:hypothetical protein
MQCSKRISLSVCVCVCVCMCVCVLGTKDKCQFAFVHWKNLTLRERQASHEGQLLQLQTENSNFLSELNMLREQNEVLQAQVSAEKEKNLIESARANTLSRKLKEFEVAKIMAVQTSVDKPIQKKKSPMESLETEEEMMDMVLKRIESQMVDPVRKTFLCHSVMNNAMID